MGRNDPLEARLWSRVDVREPDECWPWTGAQNQRGYGHISHNNRNRMVPQVAWEVANATPFPKGKIACHSCDNPSCANPAHIWPGTTQENALDCVAKGRHRVRSRELPHCKHGHPFSGDNLRLLPNGARRCLTCCRAARRRFEARHSVVRSARILAESLEARVATCADQQLSGELKAAAAFIRDHLEACQ